MGQSTGKAIMKAALYVRVSTKDQTTAIQEGELRRWAERLGLEVVRVYADTASGARDDRAALGAVLAGAHRREFDVLLLWALDRLTREGIGATARYLEQLRAAGGRVMSHQEPWLDSGGPAGDLLLAVFAWVAQQERQRIGERVRAGQARARGQGVKLGRKSRVVDLQDLQVRRAQGQGWRQIARAMKVPVQDPSAPVEAVAKFPGRIEPLVFPVGADFRGSSGEWRKVRFLEPPSSTRVVDPPWQHSRCRRDLRPSCRWAIHEPMTPRSGADQNWAGVE